MAADEVVERGGARERAVLGIAAHEDALDRRRVAADVRARVVESAALLHDHAFRSRGTQVARDRVAERDPRVGELRNLRQRLRAAGRDRDRNAWYLHGLGPDASFDHGVIVAVVRRRRVREQETEELDELAEPGDALAGGEGLVAEHGGVEAGAARADAEYESSSGDVIERDRVLRERERMPQVRGRDHRAESDPIGRARQSGEPRDRREPRPAPVAAPGRVVIGPEVVVAERLEVPGPRSRLRPRIGREHHHADAHRPSLARLAGAAATVRTRHGIIRGLPRPPRHLRVGEGGFEPPTSCSQSTCATAAPLPGADDRDPSVVAQPGWPTGPGWGGERRGDARRRGPALFPGSIGSSWCPSP